MGNLIAETKNIYPGTIYQYSTYSFKTKQPKTEFYREKKNFLYYSLIKIKCEKLD